MKIKWFICVCIILAGNCLFGQTAPVTSAPLIGNAVNGHTVAAPVTVTNFMDIGAFTLTLTYQTSSLTFQSATPNPAFTGLTVNTSTPGRIIIAWTGTNGITLPDQAQLISITFNYISGTSSLTWNTTGINCQYKKYSGGSFTVLPDSPKTSYYINGVIASHVAPVTYAPVVTNATPGTIYLPITVKNYKGIGSFTLSLTYDISTLTYQNSFTQNPIFTGNFVVGTEEWTPGKRLMTISWFGNSGNLADGSTLVTLKFNYSTGFSSGNSSLLSWFEMGPSCEYADGASVVLYDSPTADYYKDGLVTKQLSPVTWMPVIGNATSGSTVPVPVMVNGFTNISTLALTFKYDPAVLTLPTGAYTPNSTFGSSLLVSDYPPGSDGKRTVVIGWNGTPKTLSAGSSLVTFNFQYNTGTSVLKWCAGGDSCEYSDALYNPLWKSPLADYFQDGLVASHMAPKTVMGTPGAITGQPVSIPITVSDFNNIGGFTLTLNYDPGVISFQAANLGSTIGGTFTPTSVEPGQIVLQWTGPAASLPDGSVLIYLTFNYLGGSTVLQLYDNGSSCLYKEGGTMTTLYDQPKATYYSNGSVSPGKTCHLTVLLEGLYIGNGMMMKAQDNMGDHFQGDTADVITVELHKATAYTDPPEYIAGNVKLSTSGEAILGIPQARSGSYYLTIKHRNSIETTSALPVSFAGSSVSYAFDALSKAYEGNMTTVLEADGETISPPLIYGGDQNQDGQVEAEDVNTIGNGAAEFLSGYIPADVYGDGQIESQDVNMVGNNAAAFVYLHIPW